MTTLSSNTNITFFNDLLLLNEDLMTYEDVDIVFKKISLELSHRDSKLNTKKVYDKFQKMYSNYGSPRHPERFKEFLNDVIHQKISKKLDISTLRSIVIDALNVGEEEAENNDSEEIDSSLDKLDQLYNIGKEREKQKNFQVSNSKDEHPKTNSDTHFDISNPENRKIIRAMWLSIINNRPDDFSYFGNSTFKNPERLAALQAFVRDAIVKLKVFNLKEDIQDLFVELQNERIRTLAGLSTNKDYTMLVDYINSVLKD